MIFWYFPSLSILLTKQLHTFYLHKKYVTRLLYIYIAKVHDFFFYFPSLSPLLTKQLHSFYLHRKYVTRLLLFSLESQFSQIIKGVGAGAFVEDVKRRLRRKGTRIGRLVVKTVLMLVCELGDQNRMVLG